MCIYIYVHTYIDTWIDTYIYIHIHTYTYINKHIHTQTLIYLHLHIYIYTNKKLYHSILSLPFEVKRVSRSRTTMTLPFPKQRLSFSTQRILRRFPWKLRLRVSQVTWLQSSQQGYVMLRGIVENYHVNIMTNIVARVMLILRVFFSGYQQA